MAGRRAIDIRGTNPQTVTGGDPSITGFTDGIATQYMDSHNITHTDGDYTHWYAKYVVFHESNHHFEHFWNLPSDNPDLPPEVRRNYKNDFGTNFSNIHGAGCPSFGYPNGWGMVRRDGLGLFSGRPLPVPPDPEATPEQLWNWQANVDACVAELERKRQSARIHLNSIAAEGNGFKKVQAIKVQGIQFDASDSNSGRTSDQLETIQEYNGKHFFLGYDEASERYSRRDTSTERTPAAEADALERHMPVYEKYVQKVVRHIPLPPATPTPTPTPTPAP